MTQERKFIKVSLTKNEIGKIVRALEWAESQYFIEVDRDLHTYLDKQNNG